MILTNAIINDLTRTDPKDSLLRDEGRSTPEICLMTGLELEVVFDVLINGMVRPLTHSSPNIRTHRYEHWTPEDLTELVTWLSELPSEYGFGPGEVWTLPRVVKLTTNVFGKPLPKDTLRRRFQKQGITFAAQLKRLGCSNYKFK
jgi:transposase